MLKMKEYDLLSALWKYRGELYSSIANPLTDSERLELESRWNILKNATEEIFKKRFDSSAIDKIGNV